MPDGFLLTLGLGPASCSEEAEPAPWHAAEQAHGGQEQLLLLVVKETGAGHLKNVE